MSKRKKRFLFSIMIGLVIIISLYIIFFDTIKQLPLVEKVDGVNGKISTEQIREKFLIDMSANNMTYNPWGAQTRTIDLPFYHTKTYFAFDSIENNHWFNRLQLEIVEDGNQAIRLDRKFWFKNKLYKTIAEYKYEGFDIKIELLINKGVLDSEIPSQLFVSMDNRSTKSAVFILLNTTYKHPTIDAPIDDAFIKEATELVNRFMIKKIVNYSYNC